MKRFLMMFVIAAFIGTAAADDTPLMWMKTVTLPSSAQKVCPNERIRIKPGCGYIISGKVYGDNGGKLKVGMEMFDRNNFRTSSHMVNPIKGTETVLVKAADKGSTTLILKDTSRFLPPDKAYIICFHAREDLSDLPNRNSEYYIKKIEKQSDGTSKLTMSKGLVRSYPAGTMVRQHFDGSMMFFNLDNNNITSEGTAFTAMALPAVNKKYSPEVIWPGTASVQITLQSSKPARIADLVLREIPAETVKNMLDSKSLHGSTLKSRVHTFNGRKQNTGNNELVIHTPQGKSGFYQMHLDWKADGIKHLEFTVKSNRPGYFKLDYNARVDGKNYPVRSTHPPVAITPDGKYHTIVFDVQNDPGWKGVITNWELSWDGFEAEIGLKKVYASDIANVVSDAVSWQPGEKRLLKNFKPRTRCRMYWRGTGAPAMTLRALDHNMQIIDNWSVSLPAGGKEVTFTVPEELVFAELTAGADGTGYPAVEQLDKYIPPFTPSHKWRGQWIWSQKEWGPFNAYVWFEKEFDLEEKPQFAVLAYMADDKSTVYVNGHRAGSSGYFHVPGRSEITNYLKQGKNRITVQVFNGEQNSGLVMNGYVKLAKRSFYIDSDSSWKCDPVSNSSREIPKNISQKVVELGDPNTTSPWAGKTGFLYAGKCGQIQVRKLTADRVVFEVRELPPVNVDKLSFKITGKNKRSAVVEIPVKPESKDWKPGSIVEVKYSPINWGGESFSLQLRGSEYLIVSGQGSVDIDVPSKPAPAIQQAEFINVGARPMIKLGGKIISPVFFLAGHTVDSRRWYELDNAREMGFENFRMEADFLHFWHGPGKYNFDWFDETMRRLFCAVPDACVTIQVYTHMPEWWLRANPDDMSKLHNNAERYKHRDKQALGSKKWLQDAGETLKVLIEHLKKSPWADRIWGINVCENGNGEWFWWRMDAQLNWAINGYSVSDYATFRSYLREKYPTDEALAKAWNQPGVTIDSAMMPHPDKVNKGSVGTLLDPRRDMQLIDWYVFRNRALAEAIIHFGKVIKDATDGKWLVGAYYGYFTELATNATWRLQQVGHNGFLEVARSPYVDYVQAPSRYTYRKLGMSDQLMHVWDTFLLHGKTVYCEQDVRLALGPGGDSTVYLGMAPTRADSIGQINRGLGMALATGTNFYYFDIAMGALYEKAYRSTVREQLEVIKKLPLPQGLIPVETAIVSDRDSTYMVKGSDKDGVFTGAISGLYPQFNELAAPYRSLNLTELLDGKAPAHKLYIMMPTLLLSSEQRKQLMDRFQKEGASVVWLYAAGPDYPGQSPSAESNADFLGIRTFLVDKEQRPSIRTTPEWGSLEGQNFNSTAPWFYPAGDGVEVIGYDEKQRPVLVRKKVGNSMHYYSMLTNLPTDFYGLLMDLIGVRRYVSGRTDQVWAGNDTITIFAKSDGRRTLNLPEGVTARGIIGPFRGTVANGEEFQVYANQSYIFLLEKSSGN